MTLKQAIARIEALEKEVAALKMRPEQHIHHHYQQPALPTYTPQPIFPQPWRWPYEITCGSGAGMPISLYAN